ncbi:MAG: cupredoxin domain-containing protein [bacterium]|nr:cupredoxin domain-containing protein [bacterium]
MNPRIIAVLLILLATVVGIVLFANQDPDEAAPGATPEPSFAPDTAASTAPQSVTVTLRDGTFTPREVTIEAGQSVVFVNESDAPAVIASDPHPTHTDMAAFESGTLESGASYLFVFNERGNWGFHDHLNPSHTGTVIVQ